MLPIARVIHKEEKFFLHTLYFSEKQNESERRRYGYIRDEKFAYVMSTLNSCTIEKFKELAHICRLENDGIILEHVGLNQNMNACIGWTKCNQQEPRVFPEEEYSSISYDVFSDYAAPVILRLSNVELAHQIPWSMISGEFYIVIDGRSQYDRSGEGIYYQFDKAESAYHRTPVTLYFRK